MGHILELLIKGGKGFFVSLFRHINTWEEWIAFFCSAMAVVLLIHMSYLYFSGKD